MATMYTGCNRMDTKSFYRGEGDLIIKDNDLISVGKAELFGRVFQVCTDTRQTLVQFWKIFHEPIAVDNQSDWVFQNFAQMCGRRTSFLVSWPKMTFQGSIQELRIVGNSDAASDYFCDAELLDGSGDGDWDDEDEPDQDDPVEWDVSILKSLIFQPSLIYFIFTIFKLYLDIVTCDTVTLWYSRFVHFASIHTF